MLSKSNYTKMIGAVSILLVMAVQAYGHTYHLGDCPAVKPMENFDINRVSFF